MKLQIRIPQRGVGFWAAATVGVPVLLSAALLLVLAVEMSITATGVHHLTSRFIALVVVMSLLIVGPVCLARRFTDVAAGTAVAATLVAIILTAGVVLTL